MQKLTSSVTTGPSYSSEALRHFSVATYSDVPYNSGISNDYDVHEILFTINCLNSSIFLAFPVTKQIGLFVIEMKN